MIKLSESSQGKQVSLPMSVMITSTSYPEGEEDWKGVFIKQLIDALASFPQIKMQYWGPPGNIHKNVTYLCHVKESIWLRQMLGKGGITHIIKQRRFDSILYVFKLLFLLKYAYKRQKSISLFHVNWLQNALPLFGTTQPALITVLGSDFSLLKFPGMTTLLRKALKKRRCVLAPNAEWMRVELEQRFGDLAQVIPIPLGISNEWFAIKRHPLSVHKHKWLVISRLTKKKIGMLFDWGKSIFHDNTCHELHLFGPMQEQMFIPGWVHYHGSTYPKTLREEWFPQATGLITLSQHDEGRPQIMLEAMAAGLPIVASNLPAHNDMIVSRQTGLLVKDENDFILGVKWLANPINNHNVASEARAWVRREVGTWSDCAKRYIDVYRMLLCEK